MSSFSWTFGKEFLLNNLQTTFRKLVRAKRTLFETNKFKIIFTLSRLDLYWRRVIRLGRAWAKNGSSSDNPSVYKYGQPDGSSIHTSYRDSPRLMRRTTVDNSSRRMIRLLARIYTQRGYQTSYRSLPKLPDGSFISSINRASVRVKWRKLYLFVYIYL